MSFFFWGQMSFLYFCYVDYGQQIERNKTSGVILSLTDNNRGVRITWSIQTASFVAWLGIGRRKRMVGLVRGN